MNSEKISNSSFLKDAVSLIIPYWKSSEKKVAWSLSIVIVALNLGLVYITVLINQWYNSFYNSLQQKNFADFKGLILDFCYLAAAYIVGAVYRLYLQQLLTIKWRHWLTNSMISDWLKNRRFYSIELLNLGTDNPDQRIAEDLRGLAGSTLSLFLGLLSSVTTLVSFFLILWNLSGPIDLTIFNYSFTVQGYMVWAAFLYAGFGSIATHLIGRKLIPLNFQQQKTEANFRYSLIRVRENSEAVTLLSGEKTEELSLKRSFLDVVSNYRSLMSYQKKLTWFTAAYGQAAVIFPLVVAAPRYFSGAIELGALMQISSAFGRVQDSLSWFIDSYTGLTEWKASVDRLRGFKSACVQSDVILDRSKNELIKTESDEISATIDINLPNGTNLQKDLSFHFQPRKNVVITGGSGKGKSTLFRVLSGLWPFAKGSIWMPSIDKTLFLPQRAYLPIGTLIEVCSYPNVPNESDYKKIEYALQRLDLAHLIKDMHESCDWSKRLSGGEQQRVVLIRAFLKNPKWLFLDEATASLDSVSDQVINLALSELLPETTIVRISHKDSDIAHSQQVLNL